MNFTTIDGMISGLERTTQVSGGHETRTTTTHICIFTVGDQRVLLKTPEPAMIADGDHIKVAGVAKEGQFDAIACKNLTTGWTTTAKSQGCVIAGLIVFLIFGLVGTVIFPLFIIFPIINIVMIILAINADGRSKTAHQMLNC